ncbi:MAG: hypothetical protein ACRD68_13780 [Pyrinomonadaceae bacterium]
MAGGWDGDALAEQMEDALERRQQAEEERARRNDSTPETRAASARSESLRLSRARIIDQLGRATNPAHRAVLERALRALESEE